MTTALGRLVEVNPSTPAFDSLADSEDVTFMPLEAVWPDGLADTTRRAKKSAVASGYTRFDDGDILVPKITPTFEAGRVALATLATAAGAATTEVHVLRARPEVERRYVTYVCRSEPFLQDGSTRLQGVGNLRRVPTDFIRQFPVEVTELAEQRAIADFLDEQTSRIDTLIGKQTQLIDTLRERREAVVSATFAPSASTEPTRVGRLLAVRPSYGVLVPTYVSESEGVPFVRVGDLLNLVPERQLMAIAPEQSNEYSRTKIIGGEVLLGVVGKMGQAALAPVWLAGANVARAVAVLRCKEPAAARLLCAWLGSADFRHQAELATSGDSIQPTLGMKDLAQFNINLPTLPDAAGADLLRRTSQIDALIAKAEEFIALARERRAALITAAVTGQIDVRTAGRAATVGA